MKDDFVPSWLEDPTAYAQSTNLDMSTVLLVAGANLVVGIVCVTIFEVLTDNTSCLSLDFRNSGLSSSLPRDVFSQRETHARIHSTNRSRRRTKTWRSALLGETADAAVGGIGEFLHS